jgi:hypothetical protein
MLKLAARRYQECVASSDSCTRITCFSPALTWVCPLFSDTLHGGGGPTVVVNKDVENMYSLLWRQEENDEMIV